MRKIICNIIALVTFLLGAAIFLFPVVNRTLIDSSIQTALKSFEDNKMIYDSGTEQTDVNADKKEKFDKLYDDMQAYNQKLFSNGQEGLSDAWSYQQSDFDLSKYGIYDSLIAEISIPAMDCDLPIYLGATDRNMAKGAAQLGQTSFPIGGKNTNCVIAGHRGSAGGKFFLDIENLKIGDDVHIKNFWETLNYKVTKIDIISPDDIDKVLIQPNKDMVTLITCHPYPNNYQRYVVYCERVSSVLQQPATDSTVQSQTAQVQDSSNENKSNSSTSFIVFERLLYIFIPIFLIIFAIIILKRKQS